MTNASSSSNKPRRDLHAEITQRLITAIESHPGDPQMPWRRSGRPLWMPENALTKNAYNGINVLNLWVSSGYGYEHVAETRLGKYIVSTIFFGYAVHGPDQLFETMIYEDEDHLVLSARKPELAVWRCATWDDAERQHEMACSWLRDWIAALKPWDTFP